MDRLQNMVANHPQGKEDQAILKALSKTILCSTTCMTCADACLSEPSDMDLSQCIRLNLDCASVCESMFHLLSRPATARSVYFNEMVQACVSVCDACARECAKHADAHEHCRICAETCRECVQACQDIIATELN